MTMQEENTEEGLCQCCLGLLILSAFSPPQQLFEGTWLMHLYICQGQIIPQRGGGQLNQETEMKDDEWLIKEERWMTPNVMTASSVQNKQNMCGSAFLHIKSMSEMLTVLFLCKYTSLETWLHPGDAESFWILQLLPYSFLIPSELCSYTH